MDMRLGGRRLVGAGDNPRIMERSPPPDNEAE